jgi:multicomponent Na+:H+ antiporter subunit D
MVLYSVFKIFIHGFWGSVNADYVPKQVSISGLFAPAVVLVVISVLYGVGTEGVYPFIAQAAETILDPEIYINAVLKE